MFGCLRRTAENDTITVKFALSSFKSRNLKKVDRILSLIIQSVREFIGLLLVTVTKSNSGYQEKLVDIVGISEKFRWKTFIRIFRKIQPDFV